MGSLIAGQKELAGLNDRTFKSLQDEEYLRSVLLCEVLKLTVESTQSVCPSDERSHRLDKYENGKVIAIQSSYLEASTVY